MVLHMQNVVFVTDLFVVNDIEDFNEKIDKGLCVSFDPDKLLTNFDSVLP